jgi:hypothetical protein
LKALPLLKTLSFFGVVANYNIWVLWEVGLKKIGWPLCIEEGSI